MSSSRLQSGGLRHRRSELRHRTRSRLRRREERRRVESKKGLTAQRKPAHVSVVAGPLFKFVKRTPALEVPPQEPPRRTA
jgi:hypothetical protein